MASHPDLKHIIVLMMENRSFDHLLGLMKNENNGIRGVLGDDYFNVGGDGRVVPVRTGAAYQGQLTIDPGHEYADVHTQMYGVMSGTAAAEPDMSGFVRNYEQLGGNGAQIMKCFQPAQVPVVAELARHYAVCDQWFSSVPGPTLPNRAFAHFGTSFGRLDMSPDYFRAKSSIYQRLKLAGKKGRIYYYSQASGSLGLTFLLSDQRSYFGLWGDFKKDCENDTLPDYAFIEPNYAEQAGVLANDQHPDHSVREGDRFIKQVYDAIRKNDNVWKSSVLIVVWDEHGGIFDHEVPPIVSHPDGFTSTSPAFAFDRLGVRVPAVVVSPYVDKGVVDHTTFEHASIPASVTEQFIGEPREKALYAREQYANTIRHLLTRTAASPRTDDPDFTADAHPAAMDVAQPRTTEPASSLHLDQVRQIYTVLKRTHPTEVAGFDPVAVVTEEDAASFIQKALAVIAIVLLVVLGLPAAGRAQTASCDARLSDARRSWGASGHPWFASALHNERVGMNVAWCRIFETSGEERVAKIEDFGRQLFTGEGIHPALGSIVPSSGLAVGGVLNLERALQSRPLRFVGSVEGRRSASGFWEAGGQLLVNGSGERDDNRHVNATVFGRHQVLPMLPHFGIGDATTLADETSYGLNLTTIGAQVNVPLPHGFSTSASLEGLRATLPATLELPPATDHIAFGGGVGWRFPLEPRSRGYRADAYAAWRLFNAVGNAHLSFHRVEAEWRQAWSPETERDPGELSFVVRFTGSMAADGDMVPFYLQPTLGGSDLHGTATLRSYRDYRFRARDALALSLEYEHGIANWPLGLFGFVDAGQVAARRSDFDLGRLRTSYGLGVTIKAGGLPVVKLYFAWGGGEGSHTTFTGNSNAFRPEGTPRGVF